MTDFRNYFDGMASPQPDNSLRLSELLKQTVNQSLSKNFESFLGKLNPGSSYVEVAAREYAAIRGLIEDSSGQARELSPTCFLQGSYGQDTAIYTINDVDIIVLCKLWHPGPGSGSSYSRDRIFQIIASPLLASPRYREKVRFDGSSMCIKVDLEIKVEILPVVFKAGNNDPTSEPFRLYRSERARWEDGFARLHRQHLSAKNRAERTNGMFIPCIKMFKHLRSRFGLDAVVSFHMECLLYSCPDELFRASPGECLRNILRYLNRNTPDGIYLARCLTPCGERDIFTEDEWSRESWNAFGRYIPTWTRAAELACEATTRTDAIRFWQSLLGKEYFPEDVS